MAGKFQDAGETATSTLEYLTRKEIFASGAKVCWLEDYSKEVDLFYHGVYCNTYTEGKVIKNFSHSNCAYQLHLPFKTGTDAIVEVRLGIDTQASHGHQLQEERFPTREDVAPRIARRVKLETLFVKAVNLVWNNKFKLKIVDEVCGEKILDIKFVPVWVKGGEHFKVVIHDKIDDDREYVSGKGVHLKWDSDAYAMAHEFSHCLGVPDEYVQEKNGNGFVRYYRPDTSASPYIAISHEGHTRGEPLATHMSAENSDVLHLHHAWFVAIEAQQLLRAKIREEITCEILSASAPVSAK